MELEEVTVKKMEVALELAREKYKLAGPQTLSELFAEAYAIVSQAVREGN